jgi:hypothetical protein
VEADDDAVDRRAAPGLAVPLEGAVGEVDLHPLGEQVRPQHPGLLPLGDGVGGDEGGANVHPLPFKGEESPMYSAALRYQQAT